MFRAIRAVIRRRLDARLAAFDDCPDHPKKGQREVLAGCELLDRHFGDPLWDEKINLPSLRIASPTNCVLGQVFQMEGGYDKALASLGLDCDVAAEARHGFLATRPGLNDLWVNEIQRRRNDRAAQIAVEVAETIVEAEAMKLGIDT